MSDQHKLVGLLRFEDDPLSHEAADEIERLQSQLVKVRALVEGRHAHSMIEIWEVRAALSDEARRCQKCGAPTNGEEAYVNFQFWCHPCADAAALKTAQGEQK